MAIAERNKILLKEMWLALAKIWLKEI